VRNRTDLRPGLASASAMSLVRRKQISRDPTRRSVSDRTTYLVSAFFLLGAVSALGIIDRAIYGEWYGKTGTKITAALNLLEISASLFLLWSGTRKIRIAPFNRFLPLAAPGILLMSVFWSLDPRLTITQGALYFFIVLGLIGLVEALDNDELMKLIALICGLSAVASVVQFLAFHEPGDFRGIFSQKNVLGQVMAGGVLAALHCMRIPGGRRFRYICLIALCTVVAFMSKSATSVLAIFVFFWLAILGSLYSRPATRIVGICLAFCSVLAVVFIVTNPDLIYELFGKDQTLTGRTLIWPYVIAHILEKPLLGWGYLAFWSALNPVALEIASATWNTVKIANAHNALLEFLLEIGIVGTCFFIFLWLRNFVFAVKCMNGPASRFGLSSLLLLTAILLTGTSEQVLLTGGQIWTILFFTTGFMCEKSLWLTRAARTQGRLRPRSMPAAIVPKSVFKEPS